MGGLCCVDRSADAKTPRPENAALRPEPARKGTPRAHGSAHEARTAAREILGKQQGDTTEPESEEDDAYDILGKQQGEVLAFVAANTTEPESEEDPYLTSRIDGTGQTPLEVAPKASLESQASEQAAQLSKLVSESHSLWLPQASTAQESTDGLCTARTADFPDTARTARTADLLDTTRSLHVLDVSAMDLGVETEFNEPQSAPSPTTSIEVGICDEHHAKDRPGLYQIIEDDTVVTFGPSTESQEVAELAHGTVVEVVEVQILLNEERIRGRIAVPEGWVSLHDTGDGFRWATKIEATQAATTALH